MINKLILMFIPLGIALGLLAAYMISVGTSVSKCIIILAIAAFLMALVMVRIAQDDDSNDDNQGG
jgi:hypothetical protein